MSPAHPARPGGRAAGRGGAGLALLGALIAASAAFLLAPPGADAARGLKVGFVAPEYQSSSAATRGAWLDRTLETGGDIVRLTVSWRATVGPEPVAPTNPADPSYSFGDLDAAVIDAKARGLEVLLTVTSAPAWAEGANRPGGGVARAGTWKPKPKKLGEFAEALATRYSGGFLGLPEVDHLQGWNEANLRTYLMPQWVDGKPKSPHLFRKMMRRFYTGAKAGNPEVTVVTGGMAPFGDSPGGTRMRPLLFLRKLFCLRPNLSPKRCRKPAKLDAVSHHPINTSGGPTQGAFHPDDASSGDLKNVSKVVNAAERAGTVKPGGNKPLWLTEFWWETNPPDNFVGIPERKHASWIAEALRLFWKRGGRVAINFFIRDAPYDPNNPLATIQSGAYFRDGSPKLAQRAFRFPFLTNRTSQKRLRVWGRSPLAGELAVERRKGGEWRTLKTIDVNVNEVFRPRVRLNGRATLRAKVGGEASLKWRQK